MAEIETDGLCDIPGKIKSRLLARGSSEWDRGRQRDLQPGRCVMYVFRGTNDWNRELGNLFVPLVTV